MMVSNTPKKLNKKFSAMLAVCVAGAFFAFPAVTSAQVDSQLILSHAQELKCAAEVMKDEVKGHFRKSRNYGKMIGASAQIRGKAMQIARRIKRDGCYRLMTRDLDRLDELTVKLGELYNEAVCRAAKGIDKPIVGDTFHVAEQIAVMLETSRCMVLATTVVVAAPIEFVQPVIEPAYGVPMVPSYSDLIAPGELRIEGNEPHSVLKR